MGKRFEELTQSHQEFIAKQKMFFVATAANEGRVNLSPKGMDSLKVLSEKRIVWLNITGSGNETAAHIQDNPRMTVMWNSYDAQPLILRAYGNATVYHQKDPQWQELIGHFQELPLPRQIFDLEIDLVQASCGFGVPQYEYVADRSTMHDWAKSKTPEALKAYWEKHNALTIDNTPTHVIEKSF